MKTPVLLFICIIALLACKKEHVVVEPPPPATDSLGGWQKISTSSGTSVNDIAFISEARGFACAEDAGLIRSLDSGKTWQLVSGQPAEAKHLSRINFTDALHGYATGQSVFCNTADGGDTWTFHNFPSAGNDLAFPVPQNGFIASQDGLYHSVDGGATWVRIQTGQWNSVFFIDADNGWAAQQGVGLFKTADGGTTWNLKYQLVPGILSIFFLNASEGWVAVADQSILRTTDGGQNWLRIPVITTVGDIQFLDENLGYAVSGKMVLRTTNGGQNWLPYSRLADSDITGLFFLDDGHGWASAQNHTILRWNH
jgi:photosystem II stability/assembly factor-like uncharacterized protein